MVDGLNISSQLSDKKALQDVRVWLIAVSADRQAVLTAKRITWMVIRGGRLGKREPCRNIPGIFFQPFLGKFRKSSFTLSDIPDR